MRRAVASDSVVRRYDRLASWYDALSLDWPLYYRGRMRAIEMLELRPGQVVVDLGCGSGLSLSLLQSAVGPRGVILGIDQSQAMLTQARYRVERANWKNVRLIHQDAGELETAIREADMSPADIDALLAVYSLSVMGHYDDVWDQIDRLLVPGTRLAIADLGLGNNPVLRPLWRMLCALGRADPMRHPWERLQDCAKDVQYESFLAGHVTVGAGTVLPCIADEVC